jgi:hypothetical protein
MSGGKGQAGQNARGELGGEVPAYTELAMSNVFRHFRRSSPALAASSEDDARLARESRQTQENDARGQLSEHAALTRAGENEARRRAAEDKARSQAAENEIRRQASDAEAHRQGAENRARHLSAEERSDADAR